MAVEYGILSANGQVTLRLVQSGFSPDANFEEEYQCMFGGWTTHAQGQDVSRSRSNKRLGKASSEPLFSRSGDGAKGQSLAPGSLVIGPAIRKRHVVRESPNRVRSYQPNLSPN